MHDDRGRESGASGQADAGRIDAVYAPPRSVVREGERPKADWTVGGAFTAALRAIRSAPLATLVWLGVFPNAWDLPTKILNRRVQSDTFVFDWGVQLRELGAELAIVAWTTLLLGGEALLALDLMRGKPASFRRFLEGVRFFPALLLVMASLSVLVRVVLLPMLVAGDSDNASWLLVTTLAALPGAAFLVYTFMVLVLLPYRLVDERKGIMDALRHGTRLIREAPARFFGLFFWTSLLMMPAFVAGLYGGVYLDAGLCALVMPVVWLSWAHAYLASTSIESTVPRVVGADR